MALGRLALGVAFLRRAGTDQRGVGGLRQDDLRVRAFLAQHAGNARDGAAGAIAGHPVVELLALEVGHDLARRGVFVDLGVGGGLELAGQEPAVLLGQFNGLVVHAGALEFLWRQHDLGAEEAHQPAALDGEAFSHGDDQRITLGGAHHGKADAGIARGGLDDGLAGLERAGLLGFLDDRDGEAVLHRTCRVERLELHVEVYAVWREVVDADGGRVADGVENAVIDLAAARGGAGHWGASRDLSVCFNEHPSRIDRPRQSGLPICDRT